MVDNKYLSKLETELENRIVKINKVRAYIQRLKKPSVHDDYLTLTKKALKLLFELEERIFDYTPLIDEQIDDLELPF